MTDDLAQDISKFFKGEIFNDESTLSAYSRDASLFRVGPGLVVYPRDSRDLQELIRYIERNRASDPTLSLTMRAAGTDMSGGPLSEGIIADVTKHMNHMEPIQEDGVWVEPGMFYRDFEQRTLEKHLILPCFPASKNLCALGGMIANNCAGEKTLRWGKMEKYVLETRVIFSDGNEYTVKPLNKEELERKVAQGNFEGDLYRNLYVLIENNKKIIEDARPKVSKNSAGYYLWNIWDGETFDLNKLLVGSQGTLGIITKAKIKLVEVEPVSKLFVIFLPDLTRLAELVNEILPTDPESVESYDDATLKLALRFLPEMLRSMKAGFFKMFFSFIPEAWMMLTGGIPKLMVLVEYTGKSEREVDRKLDELEEKLKRFPYKMRRARSQDESEKYWTIRRESFNLLRRHVKGSRTAPFVDDVVVRPEDMPTFLPRMKAILDEAKLTYTIAGHAGNGNFHIIPLMDMKDKNNIKVIEKVSEKVYSLVSEYHGSISGEHNDGIVRTPYLHKMYSREVLELFKKTKEIFDPKNIFNPGKKVPSAQAGTMEYLEKHISIE